jgi:hypothetical protein
MPRFEAGSGVGVAQVDLVAARRHGGGELEDHRDTTHRPGQEGRDEGDPHGWSTRGVP